MTTEKSGRCVRQTFGKSKWLSFGGWINAIIPILIVPYYSVIGGWVIKYLVEYVKGNGHRIWQRMVISQNLFQMEYPQRSVFLYLHYLQSGIIYAGVRNGVERVSKFMMPVLVVLSVVIIAVYSVTRPGALEGVKYFLIPNPEEFFMDDSSSCNGTDVLFPFYCNGYSGDIWFLYEERCVY